EELTEDWSPRTWARLEGRDPAEVADDWDEPDDEWGEFEAFEGEGEETGGEETGGEETGGEETGGEETGGEPEPDGAEPERAPERPAVTGLDPEDGKVLRKMLEAKPFTPEDLPPEAIGKLRGDDGSWGIFAYPNYDAADIFLG